MSKLDEILYKRLDAIREELDSYIANKIIIKTPIVTPVLSAPQKHFALGIPPKSKMKYEDEDLEADEYWDDEEECLEKKNAVPMRSMVSAPVDIRIPDFLKRSASVSSLDEVLEQKGETFSSMLLRLIDEKGLKDSDVYKKANIDRRLFSKIRGDEDYVPSKKTAISFCLALQLDVDEAKKLLETAGYALSDSSRFDIIIMYLIENREYNIHFANIVLNDYGEGTLSK